ncbi:MAG: histidine kinase [Zoogloeaceae bacterium]|nr:histidine kinase [Zoogloeaceae bacterium]
MGPEAGPWHSFGPLVPVPDFRNLGVILRAIAVINVLLLLTAAMVSSELAGIPDQIGLLVARAELPLLFALLLAAGVAPYLRSRHGLVAWSGVLGLAWIAAGLWMAVLPEGLRIRSWQCLGWAALAVLVAWAYFAYRSHRQSPAQVEARLLALTARIRPHFFFNSLNGVLGILREDPRRAERALEELADLFRVLMRDNRELVRLDEEVALGRRYLDLEFLRLGDRLEVDWKDDGCPGDAQVPPLLLQPLLENAVYHGIEPSGRRGRVEVILRKAGDVILIDVVNPVPIANVGDAVPAPGNRMALANLKERLMLFFDLEAKLVIREGDGWYSVQVRLPYRRGGV